MGSEIFPCGNESTVSRRWRENTAGRRHRRQGCRAAFDQVPVWCIATGLPFTHTHTHIYIGKEGIVGYVW